MWLVAERRAHRRRGIACGGTVRAYHVGQRLSVAQLQHFVNNHETAPTAERPPKVKVEKGSLGLHSIRLLGCSFKDGILGSQL